MVLTRSLRQHPGHVALLRLRDAGIWFLYPWLLMELALPLHPEDTALQPLILRVLIYLPCWTSGLWLSSTGAVLGFRAMLRRCDVMPAVLSVVLTLSTWILVLEKCSSSRHLFQFVTTPWLFR